jgi:hypothetical protein
MALQGLSMSQHDSPFKIMAKGAESGQSSLSNQGGVVIEKEQSRENGNVTNWYTFWVIKKGKLE